MRSATAEWNLKEEREFKMNIYSKAKAIRNEIVKKFPVLEETEYVVKSHDEFYSDMSAYTEGKKDEYMSVCIDANSDGFLFVTLAKCKSYHKPFENLVRSLCEKYEVEVDSYLFDEAITKEAKFFK